MAKERALSYRLKNASEGLIGLRIVDARRVLREDRPIPAATRIRVAFPWQFVAISRISVSNRERC